MTRARRKLIRCQRRQARQLKRLLQRVALAREVA